LTGSFALRDPMNAPASPHNERTIMPRSGDKIFANLGCGPRGANRSSLIFDGWRELRVDIEAGVDPDILADITDLSQIPSESVDGAWCSHCVEHLHQHQVVPALREIRRILAPNGVACILAPDLQAIARFIAADQLHATVYHAPAGPISAHDVVFGYGPDIARGRSHMAHRCGFTPSVLVDCLKAASFDQFVVVRRANFELAALASKTGWRSEAERESMMRLLRS
jgi:SAM-dependent methyltransferase